MVDTVTHPELSGLNQAGISQGCPGKGTAQLGHHSHNVEALEY